MRLGLKGRKKHLLYFCVTFVTIILGMQLVASVVWAADTAHTGPGVTIIQLSHDEDSDWAVADLQDRLTEFITDDPFFQDRIKVIKTSDPYVAESINDRIIIYVSHGGPLGIVTGRYLTSWSRMAQIVENSHASMHLFTACSSRNIIRHGSDDSGKQLYTVPGARPAEVTNVEITTTVMLAFGLDPEEVSEYRTSELIEAKELIQSGESIHIMDFEEIILSEIENIDGNYSDTYTSDYKVYREAEELIFDDYYDFSSLPDEVKYLLSDYFIWYIDTEGNGVQRFFSAISISYVKNYYIESNWIANPRPPPDPTFQPDPGSGPESVVYLEALFFSPGHWENSTPVFTGGTYSGMVKYTGDGFIYEQVIINVTASGPTLDASGKTEVDSISLHQIDAGGTYVLQQKIDAVWQEPVVGRNPKRTGGSWSESAVKADYEYEPTWPGIPGRFADEGNLHSSGEYLYVDSIPTGTGWHGPSFVRALPSYFKMNDMGSISTNLSIFHGNDGTRVRMLAVSLYDEDMKLAVVMEVIDEHGYTSGPDAQKERFSACYYLEDGTPASLNSDSIYGDASGIVQIRFEPTTGVFADVPGKNPYLLFDWTEINTERLIKYVAIQSYRCASYPLNDARIYNIQMTYAGSEYTVFHDSCNDLDGFHNDTAFALDPSAPEGEFIVPSGASYMKATSIPTGSGWHGPAYVQVLDRPFRLSQLTDFSVVSEHILGSVDKMGVTHVCLYDENQECVLRVLWGDASSTSTSSYMFATFYQQDGGYFDQYYSTSSSFTVTAKFWWDSWDGGEGAILSSIDGVTSEPLGLVENGSRVIKYIVLHGLRYSSNTLADTRIHDINVVADLKFSQRATAFIDNCDDMDNFESDPTFGWGVVADGELYVPSGTSYMTPTGIPNIPSGWHGPNYVHELERPFRLRELNDFRVNGALVQQSSQMGWMGVGLFDADKQLVMQIYWGDSWYSSSTGYFHVVYYPEGGGSASDTTGYIYTTFDRTGKLWVDEGRVKYEITGVQSGDLGEVANPVRQVKYVVLRPARYSGFPLSDLRLDEILISAGLTTSVPEPEEADGTGEGILTQAVQYQAESFLTQALSVTEPYWTGPWPELHYVFEAPSDVPELEFILHFKVSILQQITVVDFTIPQAMISIIQGFWPTIMEKLVEWLFLTVWAQIALSAWALLEENPEAGVAVLAVAIGASVCTVGIPLFYSDILIDSGWEPGWVVAILAVQCLWMLYAAFGNILVGYLVMVFTGLAYPSMLFSSYSTLAAICNRALFARFMAFIFMLAYWWLASTIAIQGGVFV